MSVTSTLWRKPNNMQRFVAISGVLFTGDDLTSVTYYSASQTVNIPLGTTRAVVKLWGASGGSGGSATGINASPAGGGGAYLEKYLTGLTAGLTLTLTIGAAGTAGASTPTNGGAGGNSSLASGTQSITTLTANGGAGSTAGTGGAGAAGGAGGSATNGDMNITGQSGQDSIIANDDAQPGAGGVTAGGFGFGAPGVCGNFGNVAGTVGRVGGCIIQWYS